MRSSIVPCLLLLCLFGAGCSPTRVIQNQLPELRVEQPTNNSVTSNERVTITGSSNMPFVFVGGDQYPIDHQTFSAPVTLVPGNNEILLVAGNGYTTTTAKLYLQRTTSTQP